MSADLSKYGKVEFDYVEASRQLTQLEIIRDNVSSTISSTISAIQELAGLVDYECTINANDIINNNLNNTVEYIETRMNYLVDGYRNLCVEIGADIDELDSVVDNAVANNDKYYQASLKKARRGINGFVYYNQRNYENESYGTSTIAISGCGPTCAAMVLSTILGEDITPKMACDYSAENHHLVVGGTEDPFFDDIFNEYGVSYTKEEQTADNIAASLESGNYIIAHVGKSKFTSVGHFIVLTGIDENGKVMVMDPYNSENNGSYDISYIAGIRRGQGMYSVSP